MLPDPAVQVARRCMVAQYMWQYKVAKRCMVAVSVAVQGSQRCMVAVSVASMWQCKVVNSDGGSVWSAKWPRH